MEDLRNKKSQEENKKKFRYLKIKSYIFKYKYRIILSSLIVFVLLFPEFSGYLIGQFITDFLGNIIKYINL